MLKIINNHSELIDFIKSVRSDFGSSETWGDWFGFCLLWDEETGEVLESIDDYVGKFTNCPTDEEYPVVINYIRDGGRDRLGAYDMCVWDWLSIRRS